ncbi:flagellar basal-body rod protein FlgF [Geomicrobium sp. JCM 19037]|uniref:flagellar hook-basal body protein n=1 Tax=Geomicrobium sp. JCM 19037 TaxID=1460634 RepID=UPI00045F44DB|nr:flagellar hook-basal body protein [Geomicrobium sp. JCM 19037]GAK05062.1 flagellar basal-body rod protein FlgF [Geomicrobium sp. JCM 19037]
MIRGYYQAASGMITQQRRTEMLNDNLANVNTPGHKADYAGIRSFPNMLIQAMNTGQRQPVGELSTGVYMQERTPDYRQGDLQETGTSTDVALLQGFVDGGGLFFAVAGEDGETAYTRNGNFAVDGEGYLTTSAGHRLLGNDGEAMLVTNEWFQMNETGEITDQEGNAVGQLDVRFAEDPNDLVKAGESLLTTAGGELPSAIGNADLPYSLQQGFVERSNVDPMTTMTDMMTAYRQFEANQTVLQAYDQNLQRAANDIGRLG